MFRYNVWSLWCSFLLFCFQNCQCSFWELRGSLGLHFCSSGRLQGCILGIMGIPWSSIFPVLVCPGLYFGSLRAPFWLNWWPLGHLGGPNALPAAQNRIFLNFALPFWRHFGRFLEVKIDENLDANLMRFWMYFGLDV